MACLALAVLVHAAPGRAADAGPVTCEVVLACAHVPVDRPLLVGLRLCNASAETIRLPRSVDGSEWGLHVPGIAVSLDGPSRWQRGSREPGCGELNGLQPKDLTALAPGECFDPLDRLQGAWTEPRSRLLTFQCPGPHSIRATYTTIARDGMKLLASPTVAEAMAAVDVDCRASIEVLPAPLRASQERVVAPPLGGPMNPPEGAMRFVPACGADATFETSVGTARPFRYQPSGDRIAAILAGGAFAATRVEVGGIEVPATLPELRALLGPPTHQRDGRAWWSNGSPAYRAVAEGACEAIVEFEAWLPELLPEGEDRGLEAARRAAR